MWQSPQNPSQSRVSWVMRYFLNVCSALSSQEMTTDILFWPCHVACGNLLPGSVMEPVPLQWKLGVLTTGPPGKSHCCHFNCSSTIFGLSFIIIININVSEDRTEQKPKAVSASLSDSTFLYSLSVSFFFFSWWGGEGFEGSKYYHWCCVCTKSLQSCPILWDPMSCSPVGSSFRGISEVACYALFQGIFLTQGSNQHLLHLLHWPAGSLPLMPSGKPHTVTYKRTKGFGTQLGLLFQGTGGNGIFHLDLER